MRIAIYTILLTFFFLCNGQNHLYDDEEKVELVQKAAYFIYSLQPDSVEMMIQRVEAVLPNHPVVPMMHAMNILWQNIPVLRDSAFDSFRDRLNETIKKSNQMDDGKQEDPEAIFFEMSARGLLAEHYANIGLYMKALDQATQAYTLVKKGFELDDYISDFLFTSGLYNYFRERYPEKYPIYRPFVWFFKSGDKKKGLAQLDQATRITTLVRAEAYVYIAYIYLRYEDQPAMAQDYLKELLTMYPDNPYLQSKYLESLTTGNDFLEAPFDLIRSLLTHSKPYYRMIGHTFMGLYLEKVAGDLEKAKTSYEIALDLGEDYMYWGEYYKSLSYLGIGRILNEQSQKTLSRRYLHKALELAETEDVKSETRRILNE